MLRQLSKYGLYGSVLGRRSVGRAGAWTAWPSKTVTVRRRRADAHRAHHGRGRAAGCCAARHDLSSHDLVAPDLQSAVHDGSTDRATSGAGCCGLTSTAGARRCLDDRARRSPRRSASSATAAGDFVSVSRPSGCRSARRRSRDAHRQATDLVRARQGASTVHQRRADGGPSCSSTSASPSAVRRPAVGAGARRAQRQRGRSVKQRQPTAPGVQRWIAIRHGVKAAPTRQLTVGRAPWPSPGTRRRGRDHLPVVYLDGKLAVGAPADDSCCARRDQRRWSRSAPSAAAAGDGTPAGGPGDRQQAAGRSRLEQRPDLVPDHAVEPRERLAHHAANPAAARTASRRRCPAPRWPRRVDWQNDPRLPRSPGAWATSRAATARRAAPGRSGRPATAAGTRSSTRRR